MKRKFEIVVKFKIRKFWQFFPTPKCVSDFSAAFKVEKKILKKIRLFFKGSEKFGRGDIKQIKTEIDSKTTDEVAEYHAVSYS